MDERTGMNDTILELNGLLLLLPHLVRISDGFKTRVLLGAFLYERNHMSISFLVLAVNNSQAKEKRAQTVVQSTLAIGGIFVRTIWKLN